MTDSKDKAEINWAETILLPKTDFPMRANLPDAEPSILKRWEAEVFIIKTELMLMGMYHLYCMTGLLTQMEIYILVML